MKRLRASNFPSLRLHGMDRKGIVAACSNALDKFGCGVVQSETWTDRYEHLFFQRTLFNYHDDHDKNSTVLKSNIPHPEKIMEIDHEMERIKTQFGLSSINIDWKMEPKKVAVFVSKYDHCLVSYIVYYDVF